jgi:hypothetical protein
MEAHFVTDWEQVTSRTREVATAELRVWKKELEFSSSSEIAWQSVMVELARKSVKNVVQV